MPLFSESIRQAATTVPVAPAPSTPAGLGDDTVLAASQALTTPTPVLVPGMARPYLAHQGAAHVAANDAIERFGCAFLGDDMGMGKTQVLYGLVAERIAKAGYAIMIAPPVAKAGYQSDLAASFPHLRLAHLHGRTPNFANLPIADIYFLSDDAQTLKAWLVSEVIERRQGRDQKVFRANAFATGAAILTRDEIHRDKGNDGKANGLRSKVMMAVGAALRERHVPIVAATGTLLTNRPVEAFIPLQIIGGSNLVTAITPGTSKVSGFLWRYCNPSNNGFGTSFGGVDMDEMEHLHEYLRRTVYVRREKSDLGDKLPHSGWVIKPLALNGVLRRYEAIEQDVLSVIREESGPDAYLRAKRAERLVQIMKMWEEAGAAKGAAAMEYVSDLTDQGRSVVVFYHHTQTLMSLLKHVGSTSYTVISGAVTGDARQQAIADFQSGKVTIMFAQIKAAGMAVTLTAAADAVFVQVPWSAGDLKQAADRILRVDDRTMARAEAGEAITWHVLTACHADGAPTFDAVMWHVLEVKAQVCDAVNAGRPVTMSDENILLAALTEWYPQANARYR